MANKITKKWSIQDLLDKYPDSVDILVEYGFHCIGCAMAQYETLEQGGQAHGLDDKKIDKMIKELNSKVSESQKKKKS